MKNGPCKHYTGGPSKSLSLAHVLTDIDSLFRELSQQHPIRHPMQAATHGAD